LGKGVELRNWRSYEEIQVKKISITCPNCGKVESDLRKYFNEKGELIEKAGSIS
jgi:4-hydroxy-3-methylbut-2-en-1-yl diphosphate synthase IspG/GcpE